MYYSLPNAPQEQLEHVQQVPQLGYNVGYYVEPVAFYNEMETMVAQPLVYAPASPASSWAGLSDGSSVSADEQMVCWPDEYTLSSAGSNCSADWIPCGQDLSELSFSSPILEEDHFSMDGNAQSQVYDPSMDCFLDAQRVVEFHGDVSHFFDPQLGFNFDSERMNCQEMGDHIAPDDMMGDMPELCTQFHDLFPNSVKDEGHHAVKVESKSSPALLASKTLLAASNHDSQAASSRKTVLRSVPRKRHRRPSGDGTPSRWHCEQCGSRFERSYNLAKHAAVHDPDRERPYGCPILDCPQRAFTRPHDLQRHLETVRHAMLHDK